MKKRITTAAAFASCLALCAAVWPQSEPAEETPTLPITPAVIATQPEIPKKPECVEFTMPEVEKADVAEPEQAEKVATAPEPTPVHISPVEETIDVPEQEPEAVSASPDSAPDNMVYVPGFGWIESQGPNHVEYAEDMYENGNKIGIMG
ncbi:MAG: hypothetical protein IJ396_05350 [Oscillibacter sp.]|nr:hypothetical protein [Oscillibacter sp.]